MAPQLKHSHAEEVIPGTVNMLALEGDDTALGQAIFPVPALDPNDPLQWPMWKKNTILIICSLYSFFSCTSLLGPSVYIGVWAAEFHISPTQASNLISYPNICYGCGTLITVPMYLKFGRRPVMLLTLAVALAGLIGCTQSTTWSGLMVARVFHALASGVCEALPVQLVNDIFFLHERATKLGWYTLALCLGATGPLYAGYMLSGGNSWKVFFKVELAFNAALLAAAFLFVEETAYKRDTGANLKSPGVLDKEKDDAAASHIEVQTSIPPRRTFLQTLNVWSGVDPDEEFFMTAIRSFSYFLVPPVLWVVTTYGIYIGLGALVFNYTFPILATQPPYNWTRENTGLLSVSNFVACLLAMPFIWSFDAVAAYRTKRNNGIREAEMRLVMLLPAAIMAPAGLILYGMTAEHRLHWIGYFVGVFMGSWGAYLFFTGTLAYAVDSYNANVSEMLIAMCCGKQLISFAFGIYLLDWVQQDGYAVVISGAFCASAAANNLVVFVFMYFGKRIRTFFAATWLSRMHRKTIKQVMTH